MDEMEYTRQLELLKIFVAWYEKQSYKGNKKNLATEDGRMVTGFKYVINRVEEIHNKIPFNYDWGPSLENDISGVMSEIFLHKHNKQKRFPDRNDWLNDISIRCGDILIAVLNGHGHLYGIYWDMYELEK